MWRAGPDGGGSYNCISAAVEAERVEFNTEVSSLSFHDVAFKGRAFRYDHPAAGYHRIV